ncbi:MAG: hypothetical protein KKF50_00065 [Nanoarchaeota archaeon]|nr:hypothetical protein [Nanoarchaeota archaeon]
MPKINFNEAKEFLDNITKEDNIVVIHHDDGDGFASGIIFYDWCKQKGAKVQNLLFSYRIGNEKPDLSSFNKIIITDIAPSGIKELQLPIEKPIFYTDHHPETNHIPEEILKYRTTDQGYIPSARTAGELTGIKKWLSIIGTITDAGDLYPENQKFINELLNEKKITIQEFRENYSNIFTNTLIYFHDEQQKAFEIIKEIKSLEEFKKLNKYSEAIEEELGRIVNEYNEKKEKIGDINFFYFETKFYIKKALAAIISRNNPKETIIFVTPQDKKYLSISARDQTRKKDMAELLKEGIKGLKNSGAGGHVPAAGAEIQSKDLEKFKENIRRSRSY